MRSELVAGIRDSAPAIPPNIVLAVLFGATAVEVGISPAAATALSLFTFAGAAQMAAVELLRGNVALSVVLVTILLINLRYVIYSASLSLYVEDMSARWRAVFSYALFDINFALATARFEEHGFGSDAHSGPGNDETSSDSGAVSVSSDGHDEAPEAQFHRGWYYAGTTAALVGSFAGATLVGALAGRVIGEGLGLSFAIPLIFVALVVPRLTDRAAAATAAVAAAVAVAAAGLPFNAGLLVAAGCGTAAGILVTRAEGDDDTGRSSGGESP